MAGNLAVGDAFFSRDALKAELKTKAVRGAAIRVISNGTAACVNFVATIVLARLLAPEEFGLFAMVVAITGFARSFIELGLGTVTVQKNELTHEEVSSLFWLNVGFGVASMATIAALSPIVAWFYGDQRLFTVCLALSTIFIWAGLTVQHRSLLERQMQFGYMGVAYVSASVMGAFVGIGLAIHGTGVWALVAREVVTAAWYAVATWALCGWKPRMPRLTATVRANLRFGADLSAFGILHYLTVSVDRVVIGRIWGATALGLYTRAVSLAMMPIDHIRMTVLGVGLAPLSALQNDDERYRRFYAALVSAMSLLYMPVVTFLIVEPETVVRLLLGERWLGAAPLLRIFAMSGLVNPLLSTFQLVLISSGKSTRYLHWGVVHSASLTAAYLIGIPWGTIGVAYGHAAATYVTLLWSPWYCFRGTSLDALLVVRSVVLPVTASFAAGVVLVIFSPQPAGEASLSGVLMSAGTIASAYAATWLFTPSGRRQVAEFVGYSTQLARGHCR
jgi:PST family polysaccharide transporter